MSTPPRQQINEYGCSGRSLDKLVRSQTAVGWVECRKPSIPNQAGMLVRNWQPKAEKALSSKFS